MFRGTPRIAPIALLLSLVIGCDKPSTALEDCSANARPVASWAELSDCELRAVVESVDGRVAVGFKEAGTVRGVDPQGRSLTTTETVSRMKQFLTDRGITIQWEAIDLPYVSARMPASLELVRELRGHPNVDYLEPNVPGTRW